MKRIVESDSLSFLMIVVVTALSIGLVLLIPSELLAATRSKYKCDPCTSVQGCEPGQYACTGTKPL